MLLSSSSRAAVDEVVAAAAALALVAAAAAAAAAARGRCFPVGEKTRFCRRNAQRGGSHRSRRQLCGTTKKLACSVG